MTHIVCIVSARLSETTVPAQDLARSLEPYLSANQRSRWQLYAKPQDRIRYLLARICALEALSDLVGARQCRGIVLGAEPSGQPMVISPDLTPPPFLRVSWSHAGDMCVASAAHFAHGIDTEPRDRASKVLALCSRLTAPEETAPVDGDEAIEFWTEKEAVQKAYGMGMRLDPRRVHIRTGAQASAGSAFTLHRLRLADDQVTTLAIPADIEIRVETRWLNPGHAQPQRTPPAVRSWVADHAAGCAVVV